MRTRMIARTLVFFAFITALSVPSQHSHAQDANSGSIPLKDLDGHFPFQVPETLEAWKPRSEQVRQQLLVALGLWPKPTLAKLEPVVHSPREMDGYSVSKVYFESLPGLYVTGTLYLPTGSSARPGKHPAVLVAHGHWVNARFYWENDQEIKNLLATGAERFESAARNHLQAKCVQLARMGCVVFQYDMLGNADSQQISQDRAHRFGLAGPNPPVEKNQWLLYSPAAEGHLQSIMGIQTINTLQSLDFLAERSDVDASRIAITGASGGGTQSFIAAAVEPRIAAAFPAVMVSTSMQGGCTCENCCGLRVGTGNVEIAGLIAPRPLGMTTADDWTRNMPKDGFPELQKLYELFGAKDRVRLHPGVQFPHNYNHVARVALYGFINRNFNLGLAEPVLERDFEVLNKDALTVWDKEHPAPKGGPEFEAEMLGRWADDVESQLQKSPEVRKQGWLTLLEPANSIAKGLTIRKSKLDNGDQRMEVVNSAGGVVGDLIIPASSLSEKSMAVQLQPIGQAIKPSKASTLTLMIRDAYGLDESKGQPLVKNPRPSASYTYGYNAPLIVRKLAVVVRVLDELSGDRGTKKPSIQAEGELGFVAVAAKKLRPDQVESTSVSSMFDFANVDSIQHPMFLPGALRYGPIDKQ